MATCGATDKFRLDPTSAEITVGDSFVKLCNATRIVEQLHKDFTEKYARNATVANIQNTPSFHLRDQPTSLLMTGETGTAPANRFYKEFTTNSDEVATHKGVVSAILKGEYDTSFQYKVYPTAISNLKDFGTPAAFKGIYGLHKVNELLEGEIRKKIDSIRPDTTDNVNISDFNKYQKRQGVKATIEEIAHRENELYREKFLNIILILVGIFIVSTQLVNKYFSFGDGGGVGGGFGFGGLGGWLSTRFGSGGSGLFSRFGGIGLGSSGRSRIGNLFNSSPYSVSRR